MKVRSIIFSAPMIRAVLKRRKSQTRRVVKPPRGWELQFPHLDRHVMADPWKTWWWNGTHKHVGVAQDCPYGQPGDVLWVRETFIARLGVGGYATGVDPDVDPDGPTVGVIYRADDGANERTAGPWTSPIHMPRRASRLTLALTDVRVERVQSISEADARSEGCERPLKGTELDGVPGDFVADERTSFAILWDSINANRPGCSWSDNPFVWCISFRAIPANINTVLARPGEYGIESKSMADLFADTGARFSPLPPLPLHALASMGGRPGGPLADA